MKVRSKQSNGFRPVTVKLKLDNIVEFEIFRAIMVLDVSGPVSVVNCSKDAIRSSSGVNISDQDIRDCARGIMMRIRRSLPKQKTSVATIHEPPPDAQAKRWNFNCNIGQAVKVDVPGEEENTYKTTTMAEVSPGGHAVVKLNGLGGWFHLNKVRAV